MAHVALGAPHAPQLYRKTGEHGSKNGKTSRSFILSPDPKLISRSENPDDSCPC